MSQELMIALFLLSLILSIVASFVLGRDLDKLGTSPHLSEGLLGLVTALGADAPEISVAVIALISGNHDLGLGVVLGSNLFNLAALLGASAVVASHVRIKRQGLLWNGGVALLVTVTFSALIFGAVGPIIWGSCLLSSSFLIVSFSTASRVHEATPFAWTN